MKHLVVTVCALIFAAAVPASALAAPPTKPSSATQDDDFGVLLTDMFSTMADVLAKHQDQTANESYLGSSSSAQRLRSAIESVLPDTSIRGARPFVSGWLLGDD